MGLKLYFWKQKALKPNRFLIRKLEHKFYKRFYKIKNRPLTRIFTWYFLS